MPITGIEQPSIINITEKLRLRKYDGLCECALEWYQDEETLLLVNNSVVPYDSEDLKCMYAYLDGQGEQYFIEVLKDEVFIPIGDVTFSKDDMPIVIGDKAYRGKGIGKQVIKALVNRAQILGYQEIKIDEIYKFNQGSQKLFESCGFERYEATEKGYRYRLKIEIGA